MFIVDLYMLIVDYIDAECTNANSSSCLYSERSASTGSLRLADFDGIKPAMNVRNTLITTSIAAASGGSNATFGTSNTL